MLDLNELKQLTAFAELGTLSKVAEQFHISTPSMTRSMQHLEESFGATLFIRGKNKIALNATGEVAVKAAEKLLREAEQTVEQVRSFAERQRTIVIRSCAPAPLWELLPKLSIAFPQMTVSSAICQNAEVVAAWEQGTCDIAILPYKPTFFDAKECIREHLFVCVPKEHSLASLQEVSFAEINGFHFLLRSELGFWETLCRSKMPASRFLVQTEEFAFYELVNASQLPCFTTDYVFNKQRGKIRRILIPITDAEANVTFYVMAKNPFLQVL